MLLKEYGNVAEQGVPMTKQDEVTAPQVGETIEDESALANRLADDLEFSGFQNTVADGPAVEFYYHGRKYVASQVEQSIQGEAETDSVNAEQPSSAISVELERQDVELLPCPFCGKPPDQTQIGQGEGLMLNCRTEGCIGPYDSGYGRAEIIRRWNTRSTAVNAFNQPEPHNRKIPEHLHAMLHELWTKAVGQNGYDKAKWIAFENAIYAETAFNGEGEQQ